MWGIEASKSIWTCRCVASKHRNRFGRIDVGHRSIEIDLDVSMWGIEASKSIWTCRCGASKNRIRFGHVDVAHRSIEIDLDVSMWGIEASKSIWTCRCGLSMHRMLERGSWNSHAEKYFRTLTSLLPVRCVFRTADECDLEWHTF